SLNSSVTSSYRKEWTMALGDGVRRNIAHVDPTERLLLRDAILELHRRHYPGLRTDGPPGGGSWWFKQAEIHQATHVHGGPELLRWHRELTNRFEGVLRLINDLRLNFLQIKHGRLRQCRIVRTGFADPALHLIEIRGEPIQFLSGCGGFRIGVLSA